MLLRLYNFEVVEIQSRRYTEGWIGRTTRVLARRTPVQMGQRMTGSMRVLVIDDDDVARELLSSTLEDAGHEVFELPSAIGATREIYQKAIDAVVLDVMMPDINGDKLAKVLRQNARGKHLAIVLVSSRPSSELEALAVRANADAVLSKSRVRKELGEIVARTCASRSRGPMAEGFG